MRPKHLAIKLSKLTPHPCENVALEQYATEGDLASYWMLAVDQLDGFERSTVVDMGAGNGILGIGALLLGASEVVFVESDPTALEALEANIDSLDDELRARARILPATVGLDEVPLEGVDIIVMNPPWGVQREKADRPFLEAAFASKATSIHVLHSDRATHLEPMAKEHGWWAETVLRTEFRLPATYEHHAQRKGKTDVKCWRFFREGNAQLAIDDDA
jgi:putative methylase